MGGTIKDRLDFSYSELLDKQPDNQSSISIYPVQAHGRARHDQGSSIGHLLVRDSQWIGGVYRQPAPAIARGRQHSKLVST